MQALRIMPLLACGLLSAPLALAQPEENLSGIEKIIPGFAYNLSVRYRHEAVSQDNNLTDAAASTARTRLTLSAKPAEKLSAQVEIDNVSSIGVDHYDSFVTDEYRGTYSVIADPVGTELNQASLTWNVDGGQSLVLGRQRILHARQRFIGGVGWRQNEQTYDAASYSRRSEVLDVDYSYVWNVNRIFNGSRHSVQVTDFDSDSHILLANYKQAWGAFSAYVYALDFENAASLSSLTYGVGYSRSLGPVALNGRLARQSDYGDNPLPYDALYLSLDGAMDVGPLRVLLGYEVLGSDDGITAFKTPLATLHAFQGWSDLFLNTPNAGIEDKYLTLSGNLAGVSLAATWHDLQSQQGSVDYGREWDLSANYTVNRFISAQLKFAAYESDGFAVDTDKLWFTLNLSL